MLPIFVYSLQHPPQFGSVSQQAAGKLYGKQVAIVSCCTYSFEL